MTNTTAQPGTDRDTIRLRQQALRRSIADDVHTILVGRHRKTQREAAEALGMEQAALQRRLSARQPFHAEELMALALWLGEQPGVFFQTGMTT